MKLTEDERDALILLRQHAQELGARGLLFHEDEEVNGKRVGERAGDLAATVVPLIERILKGEQE